MSLKNKTIVGLLLTLVSGVGSVFAAPPGIVEEVTAVSTQDGGITVSWSAAEGAVSYNVYYSRQSILGNEGDYEDFESTADNATTFVFSEPPFDAETMYIAVLAVSENGEEGEGFATEALVDLPQRAVSSSVSSVSHSSTTHEPLTLRSIQTTSATGIVLVFSKPLRENITPGYFVLTDTGGTILRIQRVEHVQGDTLLLETLPQQSGLQYILGLLQNIPALDGTFMTVSSPRILFDAYTTEVIGVPEVPYIPNPALGNASSSAPASPPRPTGPMNVDTAASKQTDGTYTVRISWTPTAEAKEYIIYSSTGGENYSRVGVASATQTSAQLRKVTAPILKVKVTMVDENGQESEGMVDTVLFGNGTSSPLPESGLPLLGAILAAGALAGSRVRLKKRT